MEIVLATTNIHKIREFREIFRSLPHLELISLHEFPHYKPPEETGSTFKENAMLKAKHAGQYFKQWVLADDSGLVVPSLNGAPGVHSRRYAGMHATDVENRQKLLEAMSLLEEGQRTAYFECALVLANHEEVRKSVEGVAEGHIIHSPKGGHGFGYDPLFIKRGYHKTFAELEENIKNRISHRYKAFERLLPVLETLKN